MGQRTKSLMAVVLGLGLMAPGLASAYDDDGDRYDQNGGDRDHDGERAGGWHDQDQHGWHGLATLSVRNGFDGDAQVFVDGRFIGMVPGNRTIGLQVPAGSRTVRVTRPGTNYVLKEVRLQMYGGTTVPLGVEAPLTPLRLENTGDVKLLVQVGVEKVWISPGASAQIPVRAGNETLSATIRGPQGEWRAMDRTFWVEPGKLECQTLRPDPTVVVIVNHDRMPIRAMVDGHDSGYVAPGDTQRIWVRPGSTNVVVMEASGRVRSNTTVVVGKGREGRVVVEPRYYGGVGVVMTDDRPGGPVRGDGCTYR